MDGIFRKFTLMKSVLLSLLTSTLLFGCYNAEKSTTSRDNNSDSSLQNEQLPAICDVLDSLSGKDYNEMNIKNTYKENTEFRILDRLNLDSGRWVVVLDARYFHGEDRYLKETVGLQRGGYYMLNNIKIIKSMQKDWVVTYLNGDLSTVDINANFYQNGMLQLSLGVVSDQKTHGFQTSIYGWTPTKDTGVIRKYYRYFEYCDVTEKKKNLYK